MKNLYKCLALAAAVVLVAGCKKDEPLKDITIVNPTTTFDLVQNDSVVIAYSLKDVSGYALEAAVASTNGNYTAYASAPAKNAGTVVVKSPRYIIKSEQFTVTLTLTDAKNERVSTQDYTINAKTAGNFVELTAPANCYIVAPGSILKFPASIGNTTQTADYDNVALGWQNKENLVKAVSDCDSKSIIVELGKEVSGNAMIIASKNGTAVWNWHIWVSDYNPSARVLNYTSSKDEVAYTIMDRALGAMSGDTVKESLTAMFYQWGRKEAIPSDPDTVFCKIYDINNVETCITSALTEVADNTPNANLNPTVLYLGKNNGPGNYNWLTNVKADMPNFADLWGGVSGTKGLTDPCPAGWRVAPLNALYCLADAVSETLTRDFIYDGAGTANANKLGRAVSTDGGVTKVFFGNQGEFSNSGVYGSFYGGTWPCGKIWAANMDAANYRCCAAQLSPSSVLMSSGIVSSYAVPVRCVKVN